MCDDAGEIQVPPTHMRIEMWSEMGLPVVGQGTIGTELQPWASYLSQRDHFDFSLQPSRWGPKASLCNEASGGIDNLMWNLG